MKSAPTIREILQHRGIERRANGRTLINRGALLFFKGKAGIFNCHVRDATNHGARVRLNGLNIMPLNFDLSFDNFRTIRKSRLVWRDGDFAGIAFEDELARGRSQKI
jgi:hypothetical protein